MTSAEISAPNPPPSEFATNLVTNSTLSFEEVESAPKVHCYKRNVSWVSCGNFPQCGNEILQILLILLLPYLLQIFCAEFLWQLRGKITCGNAA